MMGPLKKTGAPLLPYADGIISTSKVTGTKNGKRYDYVGFRMGRDDNGYPKRITITLEGDQVLLTGEHLGNPCGKLDPNYKPRVNKDYVRYHKLSQLDPDFNPEGYNFSLLVQKSLLEGKEGYVKIEANGEGFFTTKYRCKLKY